jgi:hypothetical protein
MVMSELEQIKEFELKIFDHYIFGSRIQRKI